MSTSDGPSSAPEEGTSTRGGPAADTPAEASAPPSDPGAAAALLEERSNQYLRLAADYDNLRKRAARDAAERARYAAEDAARALLPVLDNLRRAVEHAPEGTAAFLLEGLEHTVRQFEEALASVGVTPIEAQGRPFDPALHEAVAGEESAAVSVDTVLEELQRGYVLRDRVLRPAVVRVAHPPASQAASDAVPGSAGELEV